LSSNIALTKFLSCKPLPDIILIDANWRGNDLSGVELIHKFLSIEVPPKIIVVTNCYEETITSRFKEAGANGYFFRNTGNLNTIIDCIKKVHTGENNFCIKEKRATQ
jgi:DNA-binding NarL/FixJ family response regulator